MRFAKKFLATAAVLGALALAPAAYAGVHNENGQCRQNCGGGQSGYPPPVVVDTEANAWAQGGDAYAQGGHGGNAVNNNTVNNSNRNDNSNYNENQNENWNQNQNQNWNSNENWNQNQNDNRNTNNNQNNNNNNATANNSNTNNAQNTNTVTASGGSATNSNTNSADNSNSNNSSQNVNVNTYNERAPVNTAYAAPLAVGEDTCMGSSSMGAQGVTFGLSIGTTWRDRNCQRLKNSRQLVALGYHNAATALMCQDRGVREAMEEAGTPCPSRANTQPAAYVPAPLPAPAPEPVAAAPVNPAIVVEEPPPAPRAPRRPRRVYGEKAN
ncbi:MAG: hypothetical protein J0L81_05690 [Caulobacterales bacterium]|nr:hypothetical protein [Caulobacterales bacterium]